MKLSQTKKISALLGVMGLSVLLAAGATEVVIRGLGLVRDTSPLLVYDDPDFGYAYLPDQAATSLYGIPLETNDQGLRSRSYPLERAPDARRFVVLGDSVTMGYGVAEQETFVTQLERELHAQGDPAEVVNAGVEGFNIHNERAFYDAVARRYDPTDVVLVALSNDFVSQPARMPYISPTGIPSSSPEAILPIEVRYRLRGIATALFAQELMKQRSQSKRKPCTPDTEAWTSEFHRLAATLENDGVQLHVALFPRQIELENPEARGIATRTVAQAAAEAGVPFLDLSPALLAETSTPGELFLPSDPVHPNARGHATIARALAASLENGPRYAR